MELFLMFLLTLNNFEIFLQYNLLQIYKIYFLWQVYVDFTIYIFRLLLKEFCKKFLEDCYNPLMRQVKVLFCYAFERFFYWLMGVMEISNQTIFQIFLIFWFSIILVAKFNLITTMLTIHQSCFYSGQYYL